MAIQSYRKIKAIDEERNKLQQKRSKWIATYFFIPIVVFIVSILLTMGMSPIISIMATVFVSIASFGFYQYNFVGPFNHLKKQVKSALLDEFMSIYHPSINFEYLGENRAAENIIFKSGLILADRFEEEDVITGSRGNIDFYLSEVNLKKKRKSKNKTSYHTIFKGILFKIKLKGKSFTDSKLYTDPGIMKKWFGSGMENEEFGFWYNSDNPNNFHKEMASLFPFIRHLSQKGDIRISVKGDEIIMLMESKMKFLDEPKPRINKSFQDEDYYATLSQQMNSMLFIIDSFADELTPLEIEEKLKLRMIEYAEERRM